MSEFDTSKYEDLPPNPMQVESLVRRVDRRVGGGLTTDYNDPDMATALVSLYAMTNRKQDEVTKGVVQMKMVLSSENLNDAAHKLNLSKERLQDNMARFVRMIAKELNSILNEPDSGARFSKEILETMRQKINSILGQEVLKEPMDETTVYDLMDLYMTTEMEGNRKASPELTGNQIYRALLRLEGNQWSEVARQTGTKETTASKEYSNTIGKIAIAMRDLSVPQLPKKSSAKKKKNRQRAARAQDAIQMEEEAIHQDKTAIPPSGGLEIKNTLPTNETQNPARNIPVIDKEKSKEGAQLNAIIDLLVHRNFISVEGGRVFKSHMGVIELSDYSTAERTLLTRTCEHLRLLFKDSLTLEDEVRNVDISRVTYRVLGNQADARNPVSRNELVRRYLAVEKDGVRLFNTVTDCERFVDRSVLNDIQKYLLNR